MRAIFVFLRFVVWAGGGSGNRNRLSCVSANFWRGDEIEMRLKSEYNNTAYMYICIYVYMYICM